MSYLLLILTTKLRVYHFQLSTLFYFLLKIILNLLYIVVVQESCSVLISNPIENIYIIYIMYMFQESFDVYVANFL